MDSTATVMSSVTWIRTMIWKRYHPGHYYAKGHTYYRITPYTDHWYLLDCWDNQLRGWAMLGRAVTLEEAQIWADCADVLNGVTT